ncbi:dimethylsulfonioproprionate lyase family protein [Chitinophaga ginsengisoli]|uniref:Quercetin dioxygenase-like cupin family protein n=1 Tax=Chitinophaga ginsengisoli TaxID=363837 RepID=A0A2P8G539_9BACT|nr:dimethylsulfonioproprionate lyase family protein [Chitinophaga ginsengisoli]PSL29102.1 quercetin dioxygenase-like cupin family protein [Chitinophaga ginsengisoli]
MKNTVISTDINDYVVRKAQKEWQPLVEKGIHYTGISVISLHYDQQKERSTTILLRFEPGASYPYHNHPAGEEVYVLSGEAIFENVVLSEGDYLYTPPGFKHAVTTTTGCTLLFVVPEEVEILV